MRWRLSATCLLIASAACSSVFLVSALKPTSTLALVFFSAWLSSPHALLIAALIVLHRRGYRSFHWHLVALGVSSGGVLFLADVIFWHPDAQGAIAVVMTPLLQAGAMVALLPVIWWTSRNVRR